MTCEKRVQKFRTDEANFQPIRHTSQILVVTRHQDGMSALVQTSFRGASQWWRSKMSAVFSRYIQGYKWFCVDSIVFVSLNSTELQSWNRAGLLWAHNLRYKTSGFDTVRIITVLPRLIMRRLYFLYNFRKWRHREKYIYISKRMFWPLLLLSRLRVLQWNLDITKGQGTGKFGSLCRGFVVLSFFFIYFTITEVKIIVCYTEDFVI